MCKMFLLIVVLFQFVFSRDRLSGFGAPKYPRLPSVPRQAVLAKPENLASHHVSACHRNGASHNRNVGYLLEGKPDILT